MKIIKNVTLAGALTVAALGYCQQELFAAKTQPFGGWGTTNRSAQKNFKEVVDRALTSATKKMDVAASHIEKAKTEGEVVQSLQQVTFDPMPGSSDDEYNIHEILGTNHQAVQAFVKGTRSLKNALGSKPELMTVEVQAELGALNDSMTDFVASFARPRDVAEMKLDQVQTGMAKLADAPPAPSKAQEQTRDVLPPAPAPAPAPVPQAAVPPAQPQVVVTSAMLQQANGIIATAQKAIMQAVEELDAFGTTNADDVFAIFDRLVEGNLILGNQQRASLGIPAGQVPSFAPVFTAIGELFKALYKETYAGKRSNNPLQSRNAFLNAKDLMSVRADLSLLLNERCSMLARLITNDDPMRIPGYQALLDAHRENVRQFHLPVALQTKLEVATKDITVFRKKLGSRLPGGITNAAELLQALAEYNDIKNKVLRNTRMESLDAKGEEIPREAMNEFFAEVATLIKELDEQTTTYKGTFSGLSSTAYLSPTDLAKVRSELVALRDVTIPALMYLLLPQDTPLKGIDWYAQGMQPLAQAESFKADGELKGKQQAAERMMETATETIADFADDLGSRLPGGITNAKELLPRLAALVASDKTVLGCDKGVALELDVAPHLDKFLAALDALMRKMNEETSATQVSGVSAVTYLNPADLEAVRTQLVTFHKLTVPLFMGMIVKPGKEGAAYTAKLKAFADFAQNFKRDQAEAGKMEVARQMLVKATETVTDFTGTLGSRLPGGVTNATELKTALTTLNNTASTVLGVAKRTESLALKATPDMSGFFTALEQMKKKLDAETSATTTSGFSSVAYLSPADLTVVKQHLTQFITQTVPLFVGMLVTPVSLAAGYDKAVADFNAFITGFKAGSALAGQAEQAGTMLTTAAKHIEDIADDFGSIGGITNAGDVINALRKLNDTSSKIFGVTKATLGMAPAQVPSMGAFYNALATFRTKLDKETSKSPTGWYSSVAYLDAAALSSVRAELSKLATATLPAFVGMFTATPAGVAGYNDTKQAMETFGVNFKK